MFIITFMRKKILQYSKLNKRSFVKNIIHTIFFVWFLKLAQIYTPKVVNKYTEWVVAELRLVITIDHWLWHDGIWWSIIRLSWNIQICFVLSVCEPFLKQCSGKKKPVSELSSASNMQCAVCSVTVWRDPKSGQDRFWDIFLVPWTHHYPTQVTHAT